MSLLPPGAWPAQAPAATLRKDEHEDQIDPLWGFVSAESQWAGPIPLWAHGSADFDGAMEWSAVQLRDVHPGCGVQEVPGEMGAMSMDILGGIVGFLFMPVAGFLAWLTDTKPERVTRCCRCNYDLTGLVRCPECNQ